MEKCYFNKGYSSSNVSPWIYLDAYRVFEQIWAPFLQFYKIWDFF